MYQCATSVVRARREVVLCGGAINSPQLLQLSGIGPGALLQEKGIATLVESPGVGEWLQDHFQVRFVYRCPEPITFNDIARSPMRKLGVALEWLFRRSGPMTMAASSGGGVRAISDASPAASSASVHAAAASMRARPRRRTLP